MLRLQGEEAAATGQVTIGQALRAVALSPAGDRPVDRADAAAVQAAEASAMGQGGGAVIPGGVAAAAQQAAETNATRPPEARGGEHGKAVTLRDVLGGDASAAAVLGDRAVTWVDAERVVAASGREGGGMGEVADALAAAAQMNEGSTL